MEKGTLDSNCHKFYVQTWEKLKSVHDPESEFDKFPQIYAIHDNFRDHTVLLKQQN